jgi:hypothetical protein
MCDFLISGENAAGSYRDSNRGDQDIPRVSGLPWMIEEMAETVSGITHAAMGTDFGRSSDAAYMAQVGTNYKRRSPQIVSAATWGIGAGRAAVMAAMRRAAPSAMSPTFSMM